MNASTMRPLSLTHLRAFEAVARKLNFSAAADEIAVTQSAVSRQIKALEAELGVALFVRGTRHVALTPHGRTLLQAVDASLPKIDSAVRQLRSANGRRRVNVSTFASFASMWLLPRIEAFQRDHPGIDIRVSAEDALVDLEDPELDLALRHCSPGRASAGAQRLFGEVMTPVVSRSLAERIHAGSAPPLSVPADLALHTLAEEDARPNWRVWLAHNGVPDLQPQRWLYLSFTHQQVQAALAGQGVALARMPLVFEALHRGELVEPFGLTGRMPSNVAYWMLVGPGRADRPEVARFGDWVLAQAADTRRLLGDEVPPAGTASWCR